MPQRPFAKAHYAHLVPIPVRYSALFDSAGLDLFRRLDFEPARSHCRPCDSAHIRFEQRGGNIACSRRQRTSSHPCRARHTDGRTVAPLLDADRRRQRVRQQTRSNRCGSWARTSCSIRISAALTDWSTAIARIAAPICPTAWSRRRASAAAITAGCWMRLANASNSLMRTPPVRRHRRPFARSKAYPVKEVRGPAVRLSWDRSRRRSCQSGSRSTGRTAFARSCWPMCRAIGFSARKTPAIRFISNGCTTIGATGSTAKTATPRPSI